jgi:hypothetical protein
MCMYIHLVFVEERNLLTILLFIFAPETPPSSIEIKALCISVIIQCTMIQFCNTRNMSQ